MAEKTSDHVQTKHKKPDPAATKAAGPTPDIQQMTAPDAVNTFTPANGPALQRSYGNQFVQRLAKGTVVSGQRRQSPAGPKTVHRSSADKGGEAPPEVEDAIERKRGSGHALPDNTRETMETGIGADFSQVNVHNDAESHQLNRSLNARAFTTGNDVFFGENEYAPGSGDGQELIAHELTHVVQQGGSAGAPQTKMEVNDPNDEFEQEADAVAKDVTSVQRQPAKDSPTGRSSDIQREDEEMSEEEKKKMEEEKNQEASEEGEKEGSDQAAGGTPQTAESEEGEPEGEEGEPVTDKKLDSPAKSDIDAPTEEDMTMEIDENTFFEDEGSLANADAAGILATMEWEAVKPPDWDQQVMAQEIFMGLFGEEAGAESSSIIATGGENMSPTDAGHEKWNTEWENTIDERVIKRPNVGDNIGAKIGWALFGEGTAGTAVDIVNTFAGIMQETNPFGVIATLLEGVIKVMELITNILGIITLVMNIVAAILYVVGLVLSLFVFTAPAGATLMGWASTLLGWATNLGTISWYITIIRAMTRIYAMLFRGASILWMLAAGEDSKAIQAQTNRLIGQAVGLAIDGITIAAGTIGNGAGDKGFKSKFGIPKWEGAGSMAGKLASTAGFKEPFMLMIKPALVSIGVTAVAGGGKLATNKEWGYGNEVFSLFGLLGGEEEEETPEADELTDEMEGVEEEGEQTTVELPPIPYDAPMRVDYAAHTIANLYTERMFLMAQLAYIDDNVRVKSAWNQTMSAYQGRGAESQQHLGLSQEALGEQINKTNEMTEVNSSIQEQGPEVSEGSDQASGDIEGQKSNIEAGAEKGEEKGHGDPAMNQSGQAANDAGQGSGAANSGGQTSSTETSKAGAMAAQSQALIDESSGAQNQLTEMQSDMAESKTENEGELDQMGSDREAILARLAEIDAEEEEQRTEHAQGVQDAETWIEESKAAIDAHKQEAMGEEGAAEFDETTAEAGAAYGEEVADDRPSEETTE